MNNSIIFSRFIVFLLATSILLMGCHSFYEIPKEEYENIDQMDDIKVVYKNGKEFIVEKDDTTNIKIVGDSLVVYRGIEKKYIGMSEIEKIKESRFDIGGTIVVTIVTIAAFLVLFFSSDPFKT